MHRNDGHRRDSSKTHVVNKKAYSHEHKAEGFAKPYYKTAEHTPTKPQHPAYVEQPLIPNAFTEMGLIEPLLRALQREGYTTPTPIQQQSIPPLLLGKDLLGTAQTGTGKTAAFLLPILQHLNKVKRMPSRGRPRVLILAPTRELAAQIGESIAAYGRYMHVTHTVIFGGVGQRPQTDALTRGMDIVVATPGRLLDLMNQRYCSLDKIEIIVLDEADRMFDMGFINDIRKIIATLPRERQSLFFSATMPPQIATLAHTMLHSPAQVAIEPEHLTVEKIVQKLMYVEKKDKDALLVDLLKDPKINKVLVFTQMKHVANKVTQKLNQSGIKADAIHGNKSQSARTEAMQGFKQGKVRVLVATDIAARGIDVDGITHVINYDLPNEPETYVHRIGRTARAGAEGDAISFCSGEERSYLRDIERLIKRPIPVDAEHKFHSSQAMHATGAAARPPPKQQWQRPQGHAHSRFGNRNRR